MGETEKSLRKHEHLSGTWVVLGDGEKWCVPALPLGKACDAILDKMDECNAVFERMREPGLTETDLKELFRERALAGLDFCTSLLQVNYPGLTQEIADERCLFTLYHATIFNQIAGGAVGIMDLVDGSRRNKPGEAIAAAGAGK